MHRKPTAGQDLLQLIWGAALVIMGLAFFFRVSGVMEQIAGIEHYAPVQLFMRIALYLIALILLGGGIKKIYRFFQQKKNGE